MNSLKKYLGIDSDSIEDKKVENNLLEAKINYEPDEEKRYKKILDRLKLTNPKLHSKIINLD